MPSVTALTIVGIGAIYVFLRVLLRVTHDAREPPVLEDSIPFLGPIISMIRQKTFFHSNLRDKYNLPIYTLRLPGLRVYIINATELIPVIQRQWRTISFTPILAKSGPTVLGMTKSGSDILHKNMTSDDNYVVSLVPIFASALAPGPSLDSMNKRAVDVMMSGMAKLKSEGTATINFWEWTHHEILMATTEAVYGPKNPYRDPNLEAAWNTFEPSYMSFALSPFKILVPRKAMQARRQLAAAWLNYVTSGGPESASDFIKASHAHNIRHGLPPEDMACLEIGHSFAIIGTTAPTAWWLTYQIFSDPVVLSDIRKELSSFVDETKSGECSIDMSCVRSSCPVLLSTFKETMRFRGLGTAVRVCLEDHLLDGRFLLKKGSMVIMPQVVHHTGKSVWGEHPDKFDHLRFVSMPGRKRPNPVAFRAFGGGHNLCPGRHFSSTEILAFAALMVLQFDVTPVGGRWVEPTYEHTPMVASFQIPDNDFKVQLKPRDDREWRISFASSNHVMEIAQEDIKPDQKA